LLFVESRVTSSSKLQRLNLKLHPGQKKLRLTIVSDFWAFRNVEKLEQALSASPNSKSLKAIQFQNMRKGASDVVVVGSERRKGEDLVDRTSLR
jgi:hypothetical protein